MNSISRCSNRYAHFGYKPRLRIWTRELTNRRIVGDAEIGAGFGLRSRDVVLAAFLVGLVLVIVATVVCVVRGVRFWRQMKRASRTMSAELATLEARSARTETLARAK